MKHHFSKQLKPVKVRLAHEAMGIVGVSTVESGESFGLPNFAIIASTRVELKAVVRYFNMSKEHHKAYFQDVTIISAKTCEIIDTIVNKEELKPEAN